jgi:GTP-binding protein HflX
LLLHVVDASSPSRDAQIAAVERVLDEIGAGHVRRLEVFNKIDRLDLDVRNDPCDNISRVFVSASQRIGIDALRIAIANIARSARHQSAAVDFEDAKIDDSRLAQVESLAFPDVDP